MQENDTRCVFKFKCPGFPKSLKFVFSRSGVEVLDPRIYILQRCSDNIVNVSYIFSCCKRIKHLWLEVPDLSQPFQLMCALMLLLRAGLGTRSKGWPSTSLTHLPCCALQTLLSILSVLMLQQWHVGSETQFLNSTQVNNPLNKRVHFRTKRQRTDSVWVQVEMQERPPHDILIHSKNPNVQDASVHMLRQGCSLLVWNHCFFSSSPLSAAVLTALCF